MEQKKILWVVVAISVFFLIIFGFALILYSPSKQSPTLSQAPKTISSYTNKSLESEFTNANQSKISQDLKDQFDRNTAPTSASSNINFTFVAGETHPNTYGTVDVSELTTGNAEARTTMQIESSNKQDSTLNPTLALANGEPVADSKQTQSSEKTKQTTIKTPTSNTAASSNSKTATTATSKATSTKTTQTTPKTTSNTKKAEPQTTTEYWIQTGSFAGKINAEKARDSLTARYLKAEIFTKDVNSTTTYRVRVGPYTSKSEAEYWLGTIKEIGDFSSSYISEVKVKQ